MPHESVPPPPWVIPWNSEGGNEAVRRAVELASMAAGYHTTVRESHPLQGRWGEGGSIWAVAALFLIGLTGLAAFALYRKGWFHPASSLGEPLSSRLAAFARKRPEALNFGSPSPRNTL